MTETEWGRTDDWGQMLYAVSAGAGVRKLRLWCVAWARALVNVAPTHEPFRAWGAGWFSPAALAAYARGIDAAEAFADGHLGRRELHAVRAATGGPWNVFSLPVGHTRLAPATIIPTLGHFANEFKLPTPRRLAELLREIFGNPFCPVTFSPEWRTDTAVAVARQMYESRDFSAMPILADALQDAGCDAEELLAHCRDAAQVHVRGCWAVDLVLGKE